MDPHIRPAEPRDQPSLGRLGAMLMRTHYAFDRHRFLAPGDDAESGYGWFLGTLIDTKDNCLLVADQDGSVVGYIWAALEPMSWKELRGPAGFIHDVAVADEARRSGIAAKLMDAAIAWLREQGAPRVVLWTAAPNEAARALFRRFGLRDTMAEMTLEL
jgi:ribosomal protein S18 acetylase RimI-like enzyme